MPENPLLNSTSISKLELKFNLKSTKQFMWFDFETFKLYRRFGTICLNSKMQTHYILLQLENTDRSFSIKIKLYNNDIIVKSYNHTVFPQKRKMIEINCFTNDIEKVYYRNR